MSFLKQKRLSMNNYLFIFLTLFQFSCLALSSEVETDAATKDLAKVLMQQRAVPNRNPSTGEIEGYRILDLQDGGVFEQVGLQKMDVIKSANGEPVDSPQKAMDLYNSVKLKNKVKWQVERDGR